MKYPLVIYHLLLLLIIIGISKQAVSTPLPNTRTNHLYTPLHIDTPQCKEQLSNNLDDIKEYSQPNDTKDNIHQYYLMTCMGSYQKNFLSKNKGLSTDQEELKSKKDMIAEKMTDSFIDCLEATRSMIMKTKVLGITVNYHMLSGTEIYTAFTSDKLLSISRLEENSNSIIDLLIIKTDQTASDLRKLDRNSVAKYLQSKADIPTDISLGAMKNNDNMANCSCGLVDKKERPIHRITKFISSMIIFSQYYKPAQELEKLMKKASELLIITVTEWLAAPEKVHPCFNKGCDSIFWYPWTRAQVKRDEKVHETYQSGKMSHWFELGAEDSDKTRELIKSFKEYLKNDTYLKYELKSKDL